MPYLIAHCPRFECKKSQPVSHIAAVHRPEFDPTLYVVVVCASCGQEFRELASALDWSPITSPSENSPASHRSEQS